MVIDGRMTIEQVDSAAGKRPIAWGGDLLLAILYGSSDDMTVIARAEALRAEGSGEE